MFLADLHQTCVPTHSKPEGENGILKHALQSHSLKPEMIHPRLVLQVEKIQVACNLSTWDRVCKKEIAVADILLSFAWSDAASCFLTDEIANFGTNFNSSLLHRNGQVARACFSVGGTESQSRQSGTFSGAFSKLDFP